jgi:hypothetical protein
MEKVNTSEIGFQLVKSKIKERGATDITEHKEGNKRFLTYTGLNGKQYKVFSRAKKAGTWQTSTNYGKQQKPKDNDIDFWLFVDIAYDPPKFYPVPYSWISNNIYEVHLEYLEKHGGDRPINKDSSHHAVTLKRIKQWENKWEKMGL